MPIKILKSILTYIFKMEFQEKTNVVYKTNHMQIVSRKTLVLLYNFMSSLLFF